MCENGTEIDNRATRIFEEYISCGFNVVLGPALGLLALLVAPKH